MTKFKTKLNQKHFKTEIPFRWNVVKILLLDFDGWKQSGKNRQFDALSPEHKANTKHWWWNTKHADSFSLPLSVIVFVSHKSLFTPARLIVRIHIYAFFNRFSMNCGPTAFYLIMFTIEYGLSSICQKWF